MVNALSGALFGLAVQFMSNSLQKLPLMRRPWEHLLWMGGGAWAGHRLGIWTAEQQKVLEQQEARKRKGHA
ncbi:hypothetical protein CDCA_CDCA04G1342 [Cyanidium caldarium]|uniref:Uncharacterized protein n=1 Tax=Cyanidium caldarium TaxID=2771 RepID=A0AAV9ISK2_CYACA|nr:hypothetical protein CDCA_CDCA04G1342 [Cyanidium caldarium]